MMKMRMLLYTVLIYDKESLNSRKKLEKVVGIQLWQSMVDDHFNEYKRKSVGESWVTSNWAYLRD